VVKLFMTLESKEFNKSESGFNPVTPHRRVTRLKLSSGFFIELIFER
jgi:hypothetical protein